jgi:serine/threonine protein phosphatase PrpC
MVKDISASQWSCTGKSVRGASHDRSGFPNQDAIAWYPESRTGSPLIVAVSDGHGSAKSFRSDLGSQLAVKTAIEVVREFLFTNSDPNFNESLVKNMEQEIERRLPLQITDRWKKAVSEHLNRHPFNDDEKKNLLAKEGEQGLSSINKNYFLAYGATLLVVAVTESFILYLQLGDGDILRIDEQGTATKPLHRSADLIANETTSLCMENADKQFELKLEAQNISTQKPALILLSTDGYANSYASDKEFFKIGRDYLQEIREFGLKSLETQLEEVLKKISTGGSGDDITIGIISRSEATDRNDIEKIPEHQESGGNLVEVDSPKRPGKTVREHQSQTQKLLVIAPLILAIGSTGLSGYLFWRLLRSEARLEEVNRDHLEISESLQDWISSIEKSRERLGTNQNKSTPDRLPPVGKKKSGT